MAIAIRAIFHPLFSIFVFASIAHADDGWTITTTDFRTQPADLRGLDLTGLHVAPLTGDATTEPVTLENIPADRFISINRAAPVAVSAKFVLHLVGGDRLPGEPGAVVNEKLTWKCPTVGEVKIPLSRVAQMVKANTSNGGADAERPKQDIATLGNGDTVAGIVTNITPSAVTIQTDGGPSDVPLDSLAGLSFAPAGGGGVSAARAFRLKLIDGTVITTGADAINLANAMLTFTPPGGSSQSLPITSIVAIEQVNGPVAWLSSLATIESVQTPYLGGSIWPPKMDLSVTGAPVHFASRTFDHAIGVHAYSRLVFPLTSEADGATRWSAFRTQYVIDTANALDNARPLADVTVRIKVDDRIVHEQAHVRAGVLYPVVLIDISAGKTLMLEADYGDGGDTQDHLNWIEPALLREKAPDKSAAN